MSALLIRIREYFEGLSARERTLLTALGAVLLLSGMCLGGFIIYDRIDSLEEKNDAMHKALRDIERKRGQYLQARARQAALESRIGQTPIQLSGFLEQAAKDTGIEIRETNPRTAEPIGKKYVQQAVDLRIGKVTLEPLLKFMRRIETHPSNLILVTQLGIRARDDKHMEFEVDMTVATYEHAPQAPARPGKKGEGEGASDGKEAS